MSLSGEKKTHMKALDLTFIQMFNGIDGFRLGLERSGWRCVWSNDIDKYACKISKKNYLDGVLVEGDIKEVEADSIPDHTLLTAGFPCQAFSVAGKRKGFQDTRGTLFYHIARVAEAKRPPLLLLENVKGLLSAQGGYCFKRILETLGQLGYLLEWQVLNSKHFGVPQNRERVFLVGHLGDGGGRQIFPIGESDEGVTPVSREVGKQEVTSALRARDYKDGTTFLVSKAVRSGGRGSLDRHTWDIVAQPFPIRFLNRNQKTFGEVSMTVDPTNSTGVILSHSPRTNNPKLGGAGSLLSSEHAFTIDSTPHKLIKDCRIRRLTPTECERLQGFPDGWTEGVSDTQRYKVLGNAVTVNVIEFLGKKLLGSMA